MKLSDHNYNHYLKRWKSQFRIYADLMNCTLTLLTEIKPGLLTAIAFNKPVENSIFFNKNISNSISKDVIYNSENQFINNIQESEYANTLEGIAGLKCFYGIPVRDDEGKTFAALCMYSKDVSLIADEKIIQLEKIRVQLEEDIVIATKENNKEIINTQPSIITNQPSFSNENKLKEFFSFSPIGMFYFDNNLIITDLNEKFAEILKSSREVLLGLNINNINDKRVLPTFQNALLGVEDEYEGEYNTSTSGVCINILLKTAPVFADKKIIGGIGIIQDISIRTNIAKALQSSENKYRELVEKINDVIFSIDANGVCTYVSPVIKLLIGYTAEEIIGYHFINFIHEDNKVNFHNAIKKVAQGNTVASEVQIKDKNGAYRWTRNSMRPVYNEEGNFVGIHGIAQDIEETKLAEISLRESEEQFRMVATQLSDVIYEWNPKNDELIWYGNPDIISSQLSSLNKFSQLNSLIVSDHQEKVIKLWQGAKQDNAAWKEEFSLMPLQSTEPISIMGSGIMLFKEDKPFKGFGTLTNISKEKQLVQHLKYSNERLEEHINKTNGLLSAIPDMMFVFDKSGYITDYHSNDGNKLYREAKDFLKRNVLDVLPKEIAILTLEKVNKVLESKSIDTYKYELTIDNKLHTFESRMVFLNDNHSLAIVRDISNQERAKEELIQAKEKAEESDRLKSSFLANMSHEIRTPMNGIIGFSELLSSKTINPEERNYYTSVIVKSGHQLLEIINDVLEISKIETGQIQVNKATFNINQVLESIQSFFLKKAESNHIDLSIELGLNNENAAIISDEGKIRQVLNNLISNSIKFTNNGYIKFGYQIVKEKYIEFYVEDNGIGIAKEEQRKIFERFTQANPKIMRQHGGTGLGLSISQSLVEIIGGKIWVDSTIDKGSRFTFSLPYVIK